MKKQELKNRIALLKQIRRDFDIVVDDPSNYDGTSLESLLDAVDECFDMLESDLVNELEDLN